MATTRPVERPYETLFVCPADAPQKTIDDLSEKIKKALSDAGAKVRTVQNWGRRRLTYPIKHNREGQFIYIDFDGPGLSARNLSQLFRVTDLVLRHMIVERVDKSEEELKAAVGLPEGEAKTDLGTVPHPETAKPKEAPSAS